MRFAVIVLSFLVIVQSAYAASAGERALAWAESQRDAAIGAVASAHNRVEAAKSDLAISRNIEREISNSNDSAALAVAHEAVAVSQQDVLEAQTLLSRTMAFLSSQERTLTAVRKFIAENDRHRALVIPVKGEIRRVSPGGGTYTAGDISAPLRAGERVEVGPGGSARLFVAGGDAEVALSQNSSFTVTRDEANDSFEAMLSEGFGRLRARTIKYHQRFEIRTPNAAVAIRGTDFSVHASQNGSRVEVFEGIVLVRPHESKQSIEVRAGEGCDILKDGGIQPVRPLDKQPRENPWTDDVSSY